LEAGGHGSGRVEIVRMEEGYQIPDIRDQISEIRRQREERER
jgi:hypothetical protein